MTMVATKPRAAAPKKRRKNKLIQPGWAGALTDEELEYLQEILSKRPQVAEPGWISLFRSLGVGLL